MLYYLMTKIEGNLAPAGKTFDETFGIPEERRQAYKDLSKSPVLPILWRLDYALQAMKPSDKVTTIITTLNGLGDTAILGSGYVAGHEKEALAMIPVAIAATAITGVLTKKILQIRRTSHQLFQ